MSGYRAASEGCNMDMRIKRVAVRLVTMNLAAIFVMVVSGCMAFPPVAPPQALLPPGLRTNAFLSAEGRTLAPGVEYRRFHFKDLYGGPLSLCLVVVEWDKASVRAGLKFCGPARRRTSDLAREAGALVAVNGGYHTAFGPLGTLPYYSLKIDGALLPCTQPGGDGTVAFSGAGLPYVGKFRQEILTHYDNVLSADGLVFEGRTGLAQTGRKAPHTGIGLSADGRLFVLAIDGRHTESQGLNLGEMADFMIRLGCVSAISLDGGGSTTMVLSDAPEDGVVNRPSDGKRFDIVAKEREICDIFYLRTAGR
jgi:hypothetical protein